MAATSSSVQACQNKIQATFDSELATGQLLQSGDFRARAGWTRQALGKLVVAGRLFYVEVGGVRAYPAFYLDLRYSRKDLEDVTKLLGDLSGGSRWLSFTTPKGSLARSEFSEQAPRGFSDVARGRSDPATRAPAIPRTPLQALEDGDVEMVKRAAAGHAQR